MSNLSLKEVKEKSETHDIEIEPIEGAGRPESSWLMAKAQAIVAIRKDVHSQTLYNASAGVFTGLNGVYWVEVLEEGSAHITL
jgi:hypothetical protein